LRRILVTGALGQIGTELVPALRARAAVEAVVASDIRMPDAGTVFDAGPFEYVDCTHIRQIEAVVRRHDIDTVFHLAALLSATGEQRPHVAWDVNMGGLYRVLEIARQHRCAVFFPSSIGVFGPGTPDDPAPQVTVQRPITMYGVTKVAGELLCDYYAQRFGVDTRGVRFPGLISHSASPGGGTTDYAVDMFLQAVRYGHYSCYLRPDTMLPMMYMPDAVRAMLELMAASPERLHHRNAYNIHAFSVTPEQLAAEIRKHLPAFTIDYEVDPRRQAIADSWPHTLDDSAAREDWGWSPEYDLPAMVHDMLQRLQATATPPR
jgi:nucleoside-diphosphate-sugar epimerase